MVEMLSQMSQASTAAKQVRQQLKVSAIPQQVHLTVIASRIKQLYNFSNRLLARKIRNRLWTKWEYMPKVDWCVTDLKWFHSVSHDVSSWCCTAERRSLDDSAQKMSSSSSSRSSRSRIVRVGCVEMTLYSARICCCCCADLGQLQRHLYHNL